MLKCDALVLAGGRASDEMAARTGTPVRALFPFKGKPFVAHTVDMLQQCEHVERIAVVGPSDLMQHLENAPDIFLTERQTISENLFAGLDALNPLNSVVICPSDNPLLSSAAMDDFLSRIPTDADIAYPYLPYADFQKAFPDANNVGVKLKDGKWIGAGCVWVRAEKIPQLMKTIQNVLDSRKNLWKVVRLLGPMFLARFALRLATSEEAASRAEAIVGMRFRMVPDCSPQFVIDVDDPEDWDYLLSERWLSC
ncbi:MAG: nucleotidyltransferase family protein [Chthonomonadales bacterium]